MALADTVDLRERLFAEMRARIKEDDSSSYPYLQDTTEFIYSRAQPGKIGFTKTINAGRYKAGKPNVLTLCGVLMHSCIRGWPSPSTAHPSA